MTKTALFSALAVLGTFTTVLGQQADTAFVADARNNAIRVYNQTVGVQSHLYNGSEYKEYRQQRDEHPYLFEDLMFGNVMYGGELYENVPLYFDLEKDQLITSYTQGNKVQLLRDKVEYFEIDNRRFVRLNNDKVAEGFYELLYDGDMKYYSKKLKVLTIKINGNDADNTFEERVKYYIARNGVYYAVKSKRSVLGLLKDRKKELKRVLKDEKIKFGTDREKATARLLEVYEQVNKQ